MIQTIAESARVGMSGERLGRIAVGMQRWIDRGTINGASMMINRRGETAYFETIGRLERQSDRPLPADAIYRIYSMTKPIVCTALMMLFEEGRFQLYTPLAKILPEFENLKVEHVDPEGYGSEVALKQQPTIGQLMSHTAGFTYDFLEDFPVAQRYRDAGILGDPNRSLAELIGDLAALPLAFQPGTRWNYSVGIDVAARVLEVLSGRPLREVLQERIIEPLRMADTDFWIPPDKRDRLAHMVGVGDLVEKTQPQMIAAWEEGANIELDVSDSYPVDRPETFQRGGHGLFSTTTDYMKFAQMLLSGCTVAGERLIGRKTLELMHTNHVAAELLPWEIGGFAAPGYGYGLGSRVLLDVGMSGSPGSVGEFGWAGAASTYYFVDPVEELAAVLMTQYQGPEDLASDFRALVYQALDD